MKNIVLVILVLLSLVIFVSGCTNNSNSTDVILDPSKNSTSTPVQEISIEELKKNSDVYINKTVKTKFNITFDGLVPVGGESSISAAPLDKSKTIQVVFVPNFTFSSSNTTSIEVEVIGTFLKNNMTKEYPQAKYIISGSGTQL